MSTSSRGSQRRCLSDHGATFVEYALVFTFLVALGVTGARAITGASSSAVAAQADCISSRPPPPTCQVPSATTTTTTTAPTTTLPLPTTTATTVGPTTTRAVTTTTAATTTTTRPATTTTVPAATGTVTVVKVASPMGATATITLKSGTNPVPGAAVRFTYTFGYTNTTNTDVLPLSCTTNASGICSVTASAPFSDTASLQVKVIGIDSVPAATSMPADPPKVTFP